MTGTVTSSGRGGAAAAMSYAERTDGGRAFHARAAATGKAPSPSVVRRVDGTTSVDVEALRRRRREPTSAVRWRVSARYGGAVPLRQRYARTHNRNWILSGTFSQCSSQRSGVMCSDLETRPAAALKTDCSRCNSCPKMLELLVVIVAEAAAHGDFLHFYAPCIKFLTR